MSIGDCPALGRMYSQTNYICTYNAGVLLIFPNANANISTIIATYTVLLYVSLQLKLKKLPVYVLDGRLPYVYLIGPAHWKRRKSCSGNKLILDM